MKHTTLIFVIFFLHAVIGESTEESGESQEVSEDRDKRQFFVTTTTSTTTLTTLKLCWIQFTSVTGSMRCRRRKRNIADRIIIDNFENNPETMISPNPSTTEIEEDTLDDIIDQRQVLDDSELSPSMEDRKGKFLNYWMTISKTMAITSFSTTSTFGSIICTPTSFEYGPCPGSGWVGK